MNNVLLNKIKKCLALSQSSNEHEAAIALKQANKLMKDNNIDLSDVELSDVKYVCIDRKIKNHTYKSALAIIIAQAMECKCLYSDYSQRIYFVGVNPELATYAYDN